MAYSSKEPLMQGNLLQTVNTGLGRRTSQAPERVDFSKISTAVRIPNLIEIQRESYNRFLQMDFLPEERENTGLQAVFQSVFPISDFRGTATLDFVEYQIGNWQCKCGRLEGLNYLRANCKHCGSTIKVNPLAAGETLCHKCGTFNSVRPQLCENCGEPVGLKHKHDQQECQERGMSYSVPLKVKIRLTVYDKDPDTEVFFGEIPLMTDNGTFIINGTERVIVSQLHRSPGVFFKRGAIYIAKIIPYRGSWVEFEYDQKNLLYVRVGKRKFLASIFLRALGLWFTPRAEVKSVRNDSQLEETVKNASFTDDDMLRAIYVTDEIRLEEGRLMIQVPETGATNLVGMKVDFDIKGRGSEPIVRSGKKVTASALEALRKANIGEVEIDLAQLEGAYALSDIVNTESGEIILEANNEITPAKLQEIIEAGIDSFSIFFPERDDVGPILSLTLKKDVINKPVDALLEIYRKMRPGDPPTVQTAYRLLEAMFFDPRKFDFSRVGRLKFNIKMGKPERDRINDPLLSAQDFYEVVSYVLKMRKNPSEFQSDDIDHLGNRRVRAVGELLENQFRIGLERMERAIKEKMSIHQDMQTTMPRDLINAKPVTAAVREFFGSSQLSQFMDQTNPLSEITHKRRLSALGPGGLSRERAGFEVRDVHPTHYGRICPIETPEGPNIGLISSLSCFARINDYGFIESPYRKVKGGRIIDYVQIVNAGDSEFKAGEIVEKDKVEDLNEELKRRKVVYEPYCFYLSAWEEDKYVVAQANVSLDERLKITTELVNCRQAGNFVLKSRDEVDYVDVSPKQLVSVAASLIPFLENDDANRALMGSNMQRQAVPLIKGEAPLVGTGMERVTARDSGAVVICKREGIVDQVDSERIIVRVESDHSGVLSREVGADIYTLTKFKRSNQNTCINQKPIVRVGDRVKKAQVLADGPCTERGELALGRNVLVAFLPWRGYNFEDAILVSEKLVKDDYYTSIHIEEYEIEARDTKLGPEEVTRDIPNISESFLRNLDESGVIRIGAVVKPGDILVGKVTPKGETTLTPEEKLLRAIFGEKAGDVRDASLYCPPGIEGTIVDVKIFTRKGGEKDERHKAIEATQVFKLEKNLADEIRILTDERLKRLSDLLGGKILQADLHDEKTNKRLLTKGVELTREIIEKISTRNLKRLKLNEKDPLLIEKIEEVEEMTSRQIDVLRKITEERKEKLRKGDELPPGVIKLVKVYIAMKRKLSIGDKMAGRHGNKGVIARIVPDEDMPYMPDGTPVEIVLNPLGVPSRMNVGQVLETHLGWAAHALGLHFASPVFDGATEAEIKKQLGEAHLPTSGKSKLFDGMTGQEFEQPVTVGYIYMLKLSHLVDDKIHARSIGPYSLITQQPLGGKAQFGGQRFGEMEVWALEAYGAAYILQELLTAKSDDVYGRTKIYEAIVKGEAAIEPGVPESFNVLIRELQSLCLDVELVKQLGGTEKKVPVPAIAAAD